MKKLTRAVQKQIVYWRCNPRASIFQKHSPPPNYNAVNNYTLNA